jgi:hypothetical protein
MIPSMDERRHGYQLKAPGSSGAGSLRLPGRGAFPNVDDHLVEPEVTRDEIIGGRRVVALPAEAPHADRQTQLDYVLRAHVAPGYQAATDLLTRHDVDSDFASDTCVRRAGTDPETGTRYLEELAFEVVSEQNERLVGDKAPRMQRRGVRRIFAIFIKKKQRVCEWSAESQSWQLLDPASQIEDRCLVKPLAVAALLDAAAADKAVAEALLAQGNPVLVEREAAARHAGVVQGAAQGEAEGKAKGLLQRSAEAILAVLEARGIAVSAAERQKIRRCRDLERLDRWLRRAALASSAGEVTAEP